MRFLQTQIYHTIKDPRWYVVQVIRRGGNDDPHSCFFARITNMDVFKNTMLISNNYTGKKKVKKNLRKILKTYSKQVHGLTNPNLIPLLYHGFTINKKPVWHYW